MATTDFGPEPLTATEALARLATMDHDEAHYDGNASLTLKPTSAGTPEFGAGTEVVFVNGIDNDMRAEIDYAATYANEIHGDVRLIHPATYGLPSDLERVTHEELSGSYASTQPPERAVAAAVLAHVTGSPAAPAFAGDLHFAAHSRGALVVARGLELAQADLAKSGYSSAQVAQLFSHVGVETYGGAASRFPEGVRALHYVNDLDPVALGFGVAPITTQTAEAVAALAAFNPLAGTVAAAYEVERALTVEPRGPIVTEAGTPEKNVVDRFLSAHSLTQYLEHRTPFEQTRAAALAHGPGAIAEARLSAVTAGVDRANADGAALPQPVSAEPWRGIATVGRFVGLAENFVAQHLGRGAYAVLDVARDLHGTAPPLGVTARVSSAGQVTPEPGMISSR